MVSVEVRAVSDAGSPNLSDADSVVRDLAQQFDGLRCFTHQFQPHIVATIYPRGNLDFTALVCCRATAEAVDVILAQYRARRPR